MELQVAAKGEWGKKPGFLVQKSVFTSTLTPESF
jgi:hypothetical protein